MKKNSMKKYIESLIEQNILEGPIYTTYAFINGIPRDTITRVAIFRNAMHMIFVYIDYEVIEVRLTDLNDFFHIDTVYGKHFSKKELEDKFWINDRLDYGLMIKNYKTWKHQEYHGFFPKLEHCRYGYYPF